SSCFSYLSPVHFWIQHSFPTRRSSELVSKRFGPPDLWWVLPPLTDFIYFVLQSALGTRYTFDFPFYRSCIPPLVQFTPIRAIRLDRNSTRLNSSHVSISYAVFCLKKKT